MNIFGIPPEWRSSNPYARDTKPKKEKEEDIRKDIQQLIYKINELKIEIKRFVDSKGKKGKELYPMLIEELKDASEELKTVLDSINKLYLS